MDKATLIGIISGIAMIIIPVIMGGGPMAFFDLMSIFIVLGGGMAATLISYKLSEVTNIMKITAKAFKASETNPEDLIRLLVDLSQMARREGLLALEAQQEKISDEFIKQSLMLVVDGMEAEVVKETMEMELDSISARHTTGQALFKTMASLFPAWGMIGTLIGLVQLLKSLSDPSKIGPAMAVALITTFYGSVLANLVCTPIANKLAIKSKEEILQKQLILAGVLSIQAGESPKILEQKLKTFLSPEQKQKYAKAIEKEAKSSE
ncbi:MAG: motility protein A [Clostridia bacterium]|nr:motility protein A [Clostridia bacterium]